MAYKEVTNCLARDTSKTKTSQKEDRVHGGLLLLNELLRVSDVKFEVNFFICYNRVIDSFAMIFV